MSYVGEKITYGMRLVKPILVIRDMLAFEMLQNLIDKNEVRAIGL